ncbi:MAG: hypothetical protein IPM49_18495 [Flavobacteriales bacterium]|nr:hypothetical protein [Flavobacteriales bacterium]
MERAAAAEAELESALAVVDLYQRRAFDAEAVADALRAQLADIMAGDAYRYVREHPEIDAAIDRAFGLDKEE